MYKKIKAQFVCAATENMFFEFDTHFNDCTDWTS